MSKTYFIDIDNTVCYTLGSDYVNSQPYYNRIEYINQLYNNGDTIIYWTARGEKSGKDWENFTNHQLDSWGCLRHNILFNKPHYDLMIDDKSISPNLFFND